MREGGKAANPLDLLGRKAPAEQVADRLLQPGEDEVGAMRRQPPDEELERGPLAGHAGGEVAGHHRELVEVGDRTEGSAIGPERDGGLRVLVHRAGPAVLGRSSQSGASIDSDLPARAAAGSISSRVGRFNCVGYSRTSSQRSRSARGRCLGPPPAATGPGPPGPRAGGSRREQPRQVRFHLHRHPAAHVERDGRASQQTQSRSAGRQIGNCLPDAVPQQVRGCQRPW